METKNIKRGKIYKITNIINGKIYVGCTIGTIKKRFKEHMCRSLDFNYKSKLYNSINKYGVQNFKIDLIEECDINIIYEREKYYILKLDTYKNGLNNTLGGEGTLGYRHNEEKMKQIIKSMIENGNTHKGKTYEELYGKKSDEEKEDRRVSVKESWDNLTESEKQKRINSITEGQQKKSKYGVELIIRIKKDILSGLKPKEIHDKYPEIPIGRIYEIKSGRRWSNILITI